MLIHEAVLCFEFGRDIFMSLAFCRFHDCFTLEQPNSLR